ncbi:OLC1v1028260C1 [Oldenlandia corymbosa var. corymbosa]|uniref:OLC1v1028260C1 n=1 Tax=Oldenlandia corymbosa var. corymbosa TaxID=529605 RepID=A0AAV1CBX3_OLDCO|nr:OLC1v1028260C1 [Oldenlandia corymbosa var. corymbosa]
MEMRRMNGCGGCSLLRMAIRSSAILTIPLQTVPLSRCLQRFSGQSLSFSLIEKRRLLSTALRSSSVPLSSASALHQHDSFPDSGDDTNVEISKTGSKVILKGLTFPELEKWAQSQGFRSGQALMLWKRIYGNDIWANSCEELEATPLFAFEGLNKDFKRMLGEVAEFKALALKDIRTAADGTRKMLFTLGDGQVIETVVIPCERGRNTVCVSSQVGCAMNCQFCYTGRMGLRRNLSTAEIVEQAVLARRLLSSEVGAITNVVFMGMGEPLHNIENVMKAAEIMVDEQGLHFSPRKVTVSTSGLVPQLKRFLRESKCALAVSLNATTDEIRNWIMPINRKYKLELLLGTLRDELRSKRNYKVLFEYVMLAGVNDSVEDAERLINLVQDIPCKINLISFNPHSGSLFKPTPEEKMIRFRNILAEAGCIVFLRWSRGDDQMAACGQLGKPGEFQAPLLRVPAQFQAALEASV